MANSHELSRRNVLGSLAFGPMVSTAVIAGEVDSADTELVALGRQFDEIVRGLESGNWADAEALWRLAGVERAILGIQATTTAGLCVKARAACWALLGDLDPTDEPTTDRRMALSIVRDLIRLHEPHLEQPNALKNLGADMG